MITASLDMRTAPDDVHAISVIAMVSILVAIEMWARTELNRACPTCALEEPVRIYMTGLNSVSIAEDIAAAFAQPHRRNGQRPVTPRSKKEDSRDCTTPVGLVGCVLGVE